MHLRLPLVSRCLSAIALCLASLATSTRAHAELRPTLVNPRQCTVAGGWHEAAWRPVTRIQFGAFRSFESARTLANTLTSQGVSAEVFLAPELLVPDPDPASGGQPIELFVVVSHDMPASHSQARTLLQRAARGGYRGFLRRYRLTDG